MLRRHVECRNASRNMSLLLSVCVGDVLGEEGEVKREQLVAPGSTIAEEAVDQLQASEKLIAGKAATLLVNGLLINLF